MNFQQFEESGNRVVIGKADLKDELIVVLRGNLKDALTGKVIGSKETCIGDQFFVNEIGDSMYEKWENDLVIESKCDIARCSKQRIEKLFGVGVQQVIRNNQLFKVLKKV